MSVLSFDIDYTEEREKLSTGFRVFYALPHLLIVNLLGQLAQLLSVLQWFFILFTGARHEGLFRFTYGILNWEMRAYSYLFVMYDPYPNFGFEPMHEPVRMGLDYEAEANRLTSALRIIWAIPAIIVAIFLGIALWFVGVVSWFAILFTGKQSSSRFAFMLRVLRFMARLNSYVYLMTDAYPKYAQQP